MELINKLKQFFKCNLKDQHEYEIYDKETGLGFCKYCGDAN